MVTERGRVSNGFGSVSRRGGRNSDTNAALTDGNEHDWMSECQIIHERVCVSGGSESGGGGGGGGGGIFD